MCGKIAYLILFHLYSMKYNIIWKMDASTILKYVYNIHFTQCKWDHFYTYNKNRADKYRLNEAKQYVKLIKQTNSVLKDCQYTILPII